MTDERIIAYLLNELPEEEMERFEDECFAQETWPSQINLVEEDLIDAYLRKDLSEERRLSFEHSYLTTEARQERVLTAAALLHQIDEQHAASQTTVHAETPILARAQRLRAFWTNQPWALRTVAALAAIAFIGGALWLSRSRTQSPGSFATLTLNISVSNTRAEGVEAGKVRLPLNADALRISLTLPEQLPAATGYRVELESDKGDTVPLAISGQENRAVMVVIPATQLSRGQYALKLYVTKADGTEQRVNGSYFFNVE